MIRNYTIGSLLAFALLITPVQSAQAANSESLQERIDSLIVIIIERLTALIEEREAALVAAEEEVVIGDAAETEEVEEIEVLDEEEAAEEPEPEKFSESYTSLSNSSSVASDDAGQFGITLNFSVFDEELFVNDRVALGDSLSDAQAAGAGVLISLLDEAGNDLTLGDVDNASFIIVDSSADLESSGRYRLETDKFTTFDLQVVLDPASADFYSVRVNGIAYSEDDGEPDTFQQLFSATDYETRARFINN